ncbi:hypothetical protein Desor_5225 [Desulfosporosinus orientis DSM 765]|uniref:Sporulation related protein n=1 Tax=Desulfosporosinus orientis (strain ATCC 19365 / DSM 765 / NCIMB 8382 / VKM B-1628 / Singapore I) TaxID=768706 RepID=G7W9P3_DESOD|nr:hypothetical protein [Desulfosporosinus orientis]AET70609.1 hypothetical protein Desor_5225 [Desulfosporosinus orientis DSM 765]
MKIIDQFRVLVVLILGLVALALLTWGIGKIYLELIGQPSQEKTVGQDKEKTNSNIILTLPKTSFWICQAGLFQNEENAQLTKGHMNVLGYKAEVISANPWIVGVGLGHSAEEIKELRELLAAQGISTIPKQIQLPQRSFRVGGNGAELTAAMLTNVNTILGRGITKEVLNQEEQLWAALAGEHPPKDLVGLHEAYNQIRSQTDAQQKNIGLSLFFHFQRIINAYSGK